MQLLPHSQHLVVDMGLDYYASSPVLLPSQSTTNSALHTQQVHQPSGTILDTSSAAFQPQSSTLAKKSFVSKYPTPPSLNYLARASDGVAGRKRSRDDTDDDLTGPEEELSASSRPISMEVRPVEPILGPGMTLVYPSGLNISPESQSGTWVEEQATTSAERPILTARKSQRLVDPTPDMACDPIVRQLGIGWKQFPEDQTVNLGMGGLETFIRRKFNLVAPRILLHHEGLALYVVRSSCSTAETVQGGTWYRFWLFRDDLKSARFLCTDEPDLFRRLANKVQDENGNWIPQILTQGPEVLPVDAILSQSAPSSSWPPLNNGRLVCDFQQSRRQQEQVWYQQHQSEDVDMECVA